LHPLEHGVAAPDVPNHADGEPAEDDGDEHEENRLRELHRSSLNSFRSLSSRGGNSRNGRKPSAVIVSLSR
jgi:hypothetical protein